ncbi:hypothetical protein OROGR_027073 [Orobanche gracilis]
MVGGGNRRDEGSFTVSNTNVFAALETLRKKKKSDKEKGSSRGSKGSSKAVAAGKSKKSEEEMPVYWAPAPLTVKSWADVGDEDDDDYYATTAPLQAIWGASGLSKAEKTQKPDPVKESESEDDLLDEGYDDEEEEVDHETQVQEQPEPTVIKPVEVFPAPIEVDRQLSKKERRRKELAELEAILADFGVTPKEKSENESSDINKDSNEGKPNGNADEKDSVPVESKNAKKKKKKDKASKEAKEPQHHPNSSDAPNEQEEDAGNEQAEEDTTAVKGRVKKMAPTKKKKSNKEMDAAARAAALEAAARSAKLAAAKKKEKNHYNQQPMR